MRYKKHITSILIVGCIGGILVFSWLNQYSNLSMKIVPKQVDKVFIKVIPEVIEITDEAEIHLVIEKLQLEKWKIKRTSDLLYAPNLFVRFKEGEVIGLFSSGEKYAKIETTLKSEYYIVPTEIYDDIVSIFNKYKKEDPVEQKL